MPRIFPIYFFTGDDDYSKKEAVRKLKKALLGKNESEAFNFDTYDIGKCDIREVIDMLKSASFNSGKRLILLRRVEAITKEEGQAIIKYAKNPSKSSCLVLEFSGREFQRRLYKEVIKRAREISFVLPKGRGITVWVQKEFKKRGKLINYNAASLLKELKENDITGLRCEIDKLVTYLGRRPAVSVEDVKILVGSSASGNVFEFVDALSKKNASKALIIAKEMLRTKKAIPEILGMVGWQFRRIKKAREYIKEGASNQKASIKCNVSPFFVERFIKEIKSFTTGEIERNIEYLLNADYDIKRGYLKPQDALELLIIKICTGK